MNDPEVGEGKKPRTTLRTKRSFEAAHKLAFLPETHKCSRLHGHSYVVKVRLRGTPDENGMLVDYADLHSVIDLLDHTYLNDTIKAPTTENVAAFIMEAILSLPRVHSDPARDIRVRVYEGAHKHSAEVETWGW